MLSAKLGPKKLISISPEDSSSSGNSTTSTDELLKGGAGLDSIHGPEEFRSKPFPDFAPKDKNKYQDLPQICRRTYRTVSTEKELFEIWAYA